MMKVFYSKDLDSDHYFFAQDSKINWLCKSLIEIEYLPFNLPVKKDDWMFFSSANGIKAIIAKGEEMLLNYKIACIGEATAAALPNHAKATFIGQGPTELVGQTFKAQLGTQNCLFIEGEQSINTVQKEIHSTQRNSLIVYRTKAKHARITEADCYFFTSPSNVKSFAESNSLEQLKNVIAMGKSTQAALLDLGIPSSVPKSFQHSDQFQTIIAQTLSL